MQTTQSFQTRKMLWHQCFKLITRVGVFLGISLLVSAKTKAQIWGSSPYSSELQYYDIATDTWTTKSSIPPGDNSYWIYSSSYYNGNVYCLRVSATNVATMALYKYNIATNTWTQLTINSATSYDLSYHNILAIDDNTLLFSRAGHIYKYVVQTKRLTYIYPNPTTSNTDIPATLISTASYDGTYYYERTNVTTNNLIVCYNAKTNTWFPSIAPKTTPIVNSTPLVYLNNAFYYHGQVGSLLLLYKWDLATNTETQLQDAAQAGDISINTMTTDGVNLYAAGGIYDRNNILTSLSNFYKYNFTTHMWDLLNSSLPHYSLSYDNPCIEMKKHSALNSIRSDF